jgi:hypothetical protein
MKYTKYTYEEWYELGDDIKLIQMLSSIPLNSIYLERYIESNVVLVDGEILSLYKLVFNTDLSDMLLYVNSTLDIVRTIAVWRLRIGK